jgi:effector-binding domain-containing protein
MSDPIIEQVNVVASPIAVVRRRIRWAELTAQIRPMFDQVYASRPAPGHQGGHNVIVYRNCDADGADVECGVEVDAAIADRGELRASTLPEGCALTATHVGPYDQLRTTNEAIDRWARAHQVPLTGVSWEVYGDWSDDPAQLRTQVFKLIRD